MPRVTAPVGLPNRPAIITIACSQSIWRRSKNEMTRYPMSSPVRKNVATIIRFIETGSPSDGPSR